MFCQNCGQEIGNAKFCPGCGTPSGQFAQQPVQAQFPTSPDASKEKRQTKKPIYTRWWFIAIVVVALIVAIGGKGNSRSKSTQQNESSYQSLLPDALPDSAKTTESTTEPVSEETAPKEPALETKSIYNVGDTLQDGDVQIVYISSGDHKTENQFMQPKEGYKYIFLKFAFINTGKRDTSISFYSFDAYADGYSAEMFYGGDDDLSATLSSGRATTGQIYFEVPIDAQEIEVEYTPNAFSNKKIKFLYEGNKDSGYVLEAIKTRTDGAFNVGETYEDRNLRITYLSSEDYVSTNMFVQPKEGYHYISAMFEFENLGSSDKLVSSFSFHCYADGAACNSTYIRDDDLQATISAGRKAKGTVTFEVPVNAEVIEIEFDNSVWTSEKVFFTVK